MCTANDEDDAEKEEDRGTEEVAKLLRGQSVTVIRQMAQRISKFSTRYVPCVDDNDPCREFINYPFGPPCGKKIFGYPSTSNYDYYIPRTYGRWWDETPSRFYATADFMPQNNDVRVGHDFVDFIFPTAVYPIRVWLFESFNPGSVIAIWAEDVETKLFHKIWSGPIKKCSAKHRIFCRCIKQVCRFKTQLLRFELSHSHLDYYAQLEGTHLIGTTKLIVPHKSAAEPYLESISYNAPNIQYIASEIRGNDRACRRTLRMDMLNLYKKLASFWILHRSPPKWLPASKKSTRRKSKSTSSEPMPDVFDVLPDEIMLNILRNLDLPTLWRCNLVNHRFRKIAKDPRLYTSLNLKPYWNLVNADLLQRLTPRCTFLRRLDMSWCGNYDDSMIHWSELHQFIVDCGKLLTNLRLNCCQFVNDTVLCRICWTCEDLKELCLNNCPELTKDGYYYLQGLNSLERLELYRAQIPHGFLIAAIRSNPKMRHLNLAEVSRAVLMDHVAAVIATSCPNFESIDCWYSRTLSLVGLRYFSSCMKLREVDFGWCPGLYPNTWQGYTCDSVWNFFLYCDRLEKIGLTAQRFFRNKDLETLVLNSKLQQLHLAGAACSIPNKYLRQCCHDLRLIDLNCYDNEDVSDVPMLVAILRLRYPQASIKWVGVFSISYEFGYVITGD